MAIVEAGIGEVTSPRSADPGTPLRTGDLGTPAGRHLLALDIDGTLVHHDRTLSPVVRDAVRRAADAGHDVVIATGRTVLGALPVIAELGLSRGYAVCSNGAVLVALDPAEPDGFRVLETVTFDPRPAIEALRTEWDGASVAVEIVGRGFRVNHPFPPGELDGEMQVVGWEDLAAHPATRVTFRADEGEPEDVLALVDRVGLHGVNYAVGYTAWLDIAPDGVSKASALEAVRQRLGIEAARTVAVGDQRNDVEMLQWAACGVAMGNAPDEVRAVADLVTDHVERDGLAAVLDLVPSPGT